jgi:2-hydroxycyclohexanecarboxyl-CoA dehydrogenase
MRFSNKVAIVTGGGAGMGKAAALGFAKEGAIVYIMGRNEATLKEAAQEHKEKDGKIIPAVGDVSERADIKEVAARAIREYGKVDILVNYAGGNPDHAPMRPFIEENEEYWDRMIETNLLGYMVFCRAVLDSMIKQKYGKIINFGAIAGRVGGPRMAAYSAAKGGVIAFTKALALEMAIYSINVNCICPGPIATPGYKMIFGEQGQKETSNFVPLKRIGTPEEVGAAVLYLASDDAAFITGQVLTLDGGITMI